MKAMNSSLLPGLPDVRGVHRGLRRDDRRAGRDPGHADQRLPLGRDHLPGAPWKTIAKALETGGRTIGKMVISWD